MNCPFINANNPHCNAHLNIQKLEDAFEWCADQYMLCPLYLQLTRVCPGGLDAAAGAGPYDSIAEPALQK